MQLLSLAQHVLGAGWTLTLFALFWGTVFLIAWIAMDRMGKPYRGQGIKWTHGRDGVALGPEPSLAYGQSLAALNTKPSKSGSSKKYYEPGGEPEKEPVLVHNLRDEATLKWCQIVTNEISRLELRMQMLERAVAGLIGERKTTLHGTSAISGPSNSDAASAASTSRSSKPKSTTPPKDGA
jgi:hypothetical protein